MTVAPLTPLTPDFDRRAVLLGGIELATSSGLEIGPSFSPIVPKSDGTRIKTVDHTDAESLRLKYADNETIDVTRIEAVDYVWSSGRLRDAVPEPGGFDYVIGSHVLEHMPNPIAFLQDCSNLLAAGGTLALALPDHRFCFDLLRPTTTIGQWIDAYDAKRLLHTPGTVADHVLHATKRDGLIAWTPAHTSPVEFLHTYDEAIASLEQARTQADYLDVHAWVFNPHSFAALIEVSNRFGLIDLQINELTESAGMEFFASLQKSSAIRVAETPDEEAACLDRMLAAREFWRSDSNGAGTEVLNAPAPPDELPPLTLRSVLDSGRREGDRVARVARRDGTRIIRGVGRRIAKRRESRP